MKTDTALSEEQLIRQAIEILIDKLGVLNATRFLAMKQQGRLESVERHQQWQEKLDKEHFFAQVFR